MERYIQQAERILNDSITNFQQTCPYQLKIGIELEFYVLDQSRLPFTVQPELVNQLFTELERQLVARHVAVYGFEEEDGDNQFEVKLDPTFDLLKLVRDIRETRQCIQKVASTLGVMADLHTSPLPGDCSNSLQFNLSLWQGAQNLFSSEDMLNNSLVLFSINGLLLLLPESMVVFSPLVEDYQRYNIQVNRLIYARGKQVAPINLSWGLNNRTTAIRIPSITANMDLKADQQGGWMVQIKQKLNLALCRVEHRIPSINCQLELSLSAILEAVKLGLQLQQFPDYYISGNAYDSVNYDLPGFANSLESAKRIFINGVYLKSIWDRYLNQE